MDNLHDLKSLETLELQFQSLINETSNDEHAQCIRLLSRYLAIYKNCFGEISAEVYEKFMTQEDCDNNMLRFLEIGLHEAITTMNMIIQSKY